MSEATLTSLLEYLYNALTPSNQRWVAEHLIEHADTEEGEDLTPYTIEELHQMVAESDRTDVAAISSAHCAPLYGLEVLKTDIQNNSNNHTRFICISRKPEIYPGADRTSLMLALPNRPGALYQLLGRFYAQGINLTKLESRPVPGRDFEFMFCFDIDASVYSPAFARLIEELDVILEKCSYLGSYSELA